jgi:DNA-3-methyladenine glycosylase I
MLGDKKELHKKLSRQSLRLLILDDNELFGRLILEISQAGLSWEMILKKETFISKKHTAISISKKLLHIRE